MEQRQNEARKDVDVLGRESSHYPMTFPDKCTLVDTHVLQKAPIIKPADVLRWSF